MKVVVRAMRAQLLVIINISGKVHLMWKGQCKGIEREGWCYWHLKRSENGATFSFVAPSSEEC